MAKTKMDRLFEMLCGEFIQLVLDKDIEQTIQNEESITMNKTPLIVEGYLVEEDDVYIFLGQRPDQISQVIKKDYIIHIQVTSEEESSINSNILEPIMEIGEIPKDPKGYN